MKAKIKKFINGILTLLLALVVQISFAQEKTISGTVTDDSGSLPGVSVLIKGTTKGTDTDFDGKYSIKVKTGDVLVFSYIGYKAVERTVGTSNIIDVQLKFGEELDEIVVTAQGIKREKKALGYAVTTVSSESLEQRTEGDVGRVLRGKSSGVQIIQQSGISGSATNIVIRGLNSFSQNNQPLFIVDGVPFSSDTNSNGNFIDGNSGSSRFVDLDPNNIESLNVLKGLSASVLYGEAGKNGVILITTKNGSTSGASKKAEITVSSSYFFNEIASLPDYQNQYGNGFDQSFGWFFSNWGPSFDRDGPAGWGGSTVDDNATLAHPYSTASNATGIPQAFPEFAGARYEWRPYKSVENFFRVGDVINSSINIKGASSDGKASFNANYSYLEDEGFTPGNQLRRSTVGFGGRAQLSNNFTIQGTMNYSKNNFITPPVAASTGNGAFGAGSSVFGHVFFTPRSVDLLGLPFQNPINGGSVYYRQNNSIQHPLWTVANAQFSQNTNRVFGNASLKYDFNDNLNLLYRAGFDFYNERNVNYQNRGGVELPAEILSGIYRTWDNNNTIFDHNIVLTGDYNLSEKFGLNFNAGATSRHVTFDRQGVASSGQNVFGVLRHFNYGIFSGIQFSYSRNIVGLYGQAEFDYSNYLFLTLATRNDWVSNFSSENRSQFYPGVSASFLPTTAFEQWKDNDALNFLKLRAAYGTSAGFGNAGQYPTSSDLFLSTRYFQNGDAENIVTNTVSNRVANPDLRPELYTEFELGIESRLFKNIVTFDVSAYKRVTRDLIIDQPLSPDTGGTITQANIGEIQSEGIEIDLGVKIFDTEDFQWTVNANFSATESEVTDLGGDNDIIVYDGFSNLGNAAIVGQPLGVMVGSRIGRDDNGNFLVNAAGSYVEETVDENGRLPIIGDPTPDWRGNLSSTVSWKGFNFNVLLSHIQGGDVYSTTVATLLGRGLTTDTVDRENTFILPGIAPDGNPNNVQINNSTYYFSNILFGPNELQVYDATTVRLQEISLGYNVPKKYLDNTPFGSLNFTFSGFNLWYKALNVPDGTNFDPNVAGTGIGTGQGFDYLNGPSSKRYGFSVKATF